MIARYSTTITKEKIGNKNYYCISEWKSFMVEFCIALSSCMYFSVTTAKY